MKFTTFVPINYNDGSPIKPSLVQRTIGALWRPFGGMTNEGTVTGCWIDTDGTEFSDVCWKISIDVGGIA